MLCYGKRTADLSDFLLFHVNLDPHNPQSFSFEVPLWEFGLPDDAAIEVRDLIRGNCFTWHGKTQLLDARRPTAAPTRSGSSIAPGGSR